MDPADDALTDDDLLDGDTVPIQVRLDAFTEPTVLRSLAGLIVALAVLIWPERTDLVLARLVGLGLVLTAGSRLWSLLRSRSTHAIRWLAALAGLGAGLILVASPDRSTVFVVRMVAILLAGSAIASLVEGLRSRDRTSLGWLVGRTVLLLVIAGILAVYPVELLALATTLAAGAFALLAVVAIASSVSADDDRVYDVDDSSRMVIDWLLDRPKTLEDRELLYAKLLYEGPRARAKIGRFFTLMALASVISATGVLSDSTAVVIGAMLVAPLMNPLMSAAMCLIMGWPRRLGTSALIAGGGILVAIGIGFILGLAAPTLIDVESNGQIVSRTTPSVLDLMTAVAAGAAGAYGLSRPDVSDSLPGVAIAISLVPPLSVVGISYAAGEWEAGNGALLLFSVNVVSILIVGGITFILTGVTPISRVAENQRRVRTAGAGVAVLAVLVAGALLLNAEEATTTAVEQRAAENALDEWAADAPDHDIQEFRRDGDTVTAVVIGPSSGGPSATDLADRLSQALGRDITAEVQLVVQESETATGRSG